MDRQAVTERQRAVDRTAKYNPLLQGQVVEPEWQAKYRAIRDNPAFLPMSGVCMLTALFGPSLFVLMDIPDDPWLYLQDGVMTFIALFFIFEMTVQTLAGGGYTCSFFFWMDMLGSISMIFEVSYLLGSAGHETGLAASGVNPVLLRAARAARMGARAARLSRLVKCFTTIGRIAGQCSTVNCGNGTFASGVVKSLAEDGVQEDEEDKPEYDARVLKSRLNASLSSKVAMLTVGLVIGQPMLTIARYPESDFSLESWSNTLELSYETTLLELSKGVRNEAAAKLFSNSVNEMMAFYDGFLYRPFLVEGFPEHLEIHEEGKTLGIEIPGSGRVQGDWPARLENVRAVQSKNCRAAGDIRCTETQHATVYYDFTESNQSAAFQDILVILFVVGLMVVETWALSTMLDNMVVRPVEGMLGTVKQMARILKSVVPPAVMEKAMSEAKSRRSVESVAGTAGTDPDEEMHPAEDDETAMLQDVFGKLLGLVAEFYKKSMIELDDIHGLQGESKGVIMDIMMLDHGQHSFLDCVHHAPLTDDDSVAATDVGFTEDELRNKNLDILQMPYTQQMQVVTWILFDSEIGRVTGRAWYDFHTFQHFHEHLRQEYHEANPYHNYAHAADVVAAVYRWFRLTHAREWLEDIDMLALLTAALAHDVGHPGKTTPYLVETGHELAIRYNDKSPLESMHCSKLFEITKREAFGIFSKMNSDAYKRVRKTCINAIIHTDNALHFDLVKELSTAYQRVADLCDSQANEGEKLSDGYVEGVLKHKDHLVTWQQLILHINDVSTPQKPWEISKAWARRVQDEFFAQGDEEKRLALPVGFLNDREKVDRNNAEHGFINFLVGPLVFGATQIFPHMYPLAKEMVSNAHHWRDQWVQASSPSQEDVAKKDADLKKMTEKLKELEERNAVSIRTTVQVDPRRTSTSHSSAGRPSGGRGPKTAPPIMGQRHSDSGD